MKTKKKGFTIVELTIVIAVIAILAAVLIPTFVSLVNKANNSADVQMVTNINKYLASIEAIDGKNETMAEALADVAEAGYTVNALQNATHTILWDADTDRFLAVDGKKTIASANDAKYDKDDATGKYWIIASEYATDTHYSYYLTAKATIPTEIKYGLDISAVAYSGKVEMPAITYNGTGRNVIINGEFQSVKINGNAETNVKLYGFVGELTLNEGNLELNGFVSNLTSVLPNNDTGTAEGSLTANGASFRQTQSGIAEITEFKKFTDNGSKYEQHYFGANGDLEKCLCCEIATVNPNHICQPGTPETEDRNDVTYLVIKCTICNDELAAVKLKTDCNGNHTLEDEYKKDPTCTQPGFTIKWCTVCENYREITEIPALGHAEVAGEAKAATCTEAGRTAGKYCKRCSTEGNTVWTEPQVEIPALGHDYDRTTGKCKHCGADQPTVTIDEHILHSGNVKEERYANYIAYDCSGYEYIMDRVVFGYKEDYIHSINATKVEYSREYQGVEVYAVYKKNPNYGKYEDTRSFLVDYYVLSDSRMQYIQGEVVDGGTFAFGLGYGVPSGQTFRFSGAVKEIRFENFDTSKTTSLKEMFHVSQIETIDLSGWDVSNVKDFENMFLSCDVIKVIYPDNWPKTAPKA